MSSPSNRRGRAQRHHAERIERERRRAESRKRVAELVRIVTDGEVKPHEALIDTILMLRDPAPCVIPDSTLLSIPGHEAVLAEARRLFDDYGVDLEPQGVFLSLRRCLSDYFPIGRLADDAGSAVDRQTRRAQAILAKHVLPHFSENLDRAVEAMHFAVLDIIMQRSSMDGILFAPVVLPPGLGGPAVRLAAQRPTPTYFQRDGRERPAWRCGGPDFTDSCICWATWPAEVRGAPSGSPSADVYLQSHALKNLRERVPLAGLNGLLDLAAYQSLEDPTLVRTGPKEWLVDFRFGDMRLGYFTAVEIEGRILITTFLFLTMRDTPEGKRIREVLGLRAEQVEWLRLDALPYFTQSDVAQDSQLRAVLTECGCGHLFELIGLDAKEIALPGKAKETRLHMREPALRMMRALYSPKSLVLEASERDIQAAMNQEAEVGTAGTTHGTIPSQSRESTRNSTSQNSI